MSERKFGPAWLVWERAWTMAERKVSENVICDFFIANKESVKDNSFNRIMLYVRERIRERNDGKDPGFEYLSEVYSRYITGFTDVTQS